MNKITEAKKGVGAHEVVHWVHITAWTKRGNGEKIESLSWQNMSFDLRIKYNWYFAYRAALLQVKHPKAFIDLQWGNALAEGKSLRCIIANKIAAKKRKVSEINRKLALTRQAWDELFPLEDYPLYQRALKKLGRHIAELNELTAHFETLNQTK